VIAAIPTRWRYAAVLVTAVFGIVALALVPAETRQGVNGVVATHHLPLYAKALDFVQRDSMYGRLASRIVAEDASAEQKALTVFDWTVKNIRNSPPELPVVDDHISHIIIRGYGDPDQKADVFTTLLTYADVPAYWFWLGKGPYLIVSLAWVDGRWRAFDVHNGIVFRTGAGALASVEDLAADPALVSAVAGDRTWGSRPYRSYFDGFQPPVAPDLLRAEVQMVWPRALYPLIRLVGLGRREWQEDR
jgi:hypothetical protein